MEFTPMRILSFFLIFLVSCSTSGSSRSFTAQIDESFLADIPLELRRDLSYFERQMFDYASPNHETQWTDSNGVVLGILSVSQIFKVGELSCRRFIHKRNEFEVLQANVCRKHNEDWRLMK